ncbi:MAG TPA: DUF4142 domain-containing protein [Polyangia bacterium]|nr:DUF4142 domain-containing protein [Polyangia bacterium]
MKRWMGIAVACVSLGAGTASAAPTSGEVLQKLHESNQKEIAAGKAAADHGTSKETKAFGRMLVKDHTAADAKVTKLAKEEKVDLTSTAPMSDLPAAGASFDGDFAKMMLEDHQKDIGDVTAARDATDDAKLKKLLTDMLPTLQKHQDTAQRILDKNAKS